jgi:hypothetical protein
VPRTLNVFPAHLGKPDFVPFADPWSSGLGAAALWAKNNRIKQRAVLGSAVADWATYQNSRESLRIVSGLAENPHSIFCDGRQGLRQRMDAGSAKQEPPPRGFVSYFADSHFIVLLRRAEVGQFGATMPRWNQPLRIAGKKHLQRSAGRLEESGLP